MLTHIALGSALISSSLANVLAPSPALETSPALITPGPQIELLRKQNNLNYMGWVQYSGRWSSETCDPGNTYYQAGGQWACCSTTRAGCLNMAIGCVNGNMIYSVSATGSTSLTNSLVTRPCTSLWTASSDRSFTVCNTAFMYENDRDNNPKSNIVCGVSSLNWSYYRQAPSTTPSAAPSTPTPSVNAPSVTPTPGAGLPTPVPQGDDADNGGGSKSKAWIAGAVVGPIAGLALIGAGIFFLMRRKKNKNANQHVAPASGSVPPPGASAYQQNSYNNNAPGSPNPPQYYPPMQQTGAAAPMAAKQDGYYGNNQQSPTMSQGPQSQYGAPQQWQQPGGQPAGQPVYGGPSPSMSPAPQNAQPAPYIAPEARPFSSELEGSYTQGAPDQGNVQPKR